MSEEHIHHWYINSENIGWCTCNEVKDFGRLLQKEGVFAVAGRRSAKARKEVLVKSVAAKKRWQNPEYRTKVTAAIKKSCQDPELRAKRSAAIKKRWQDPELRARRSAALKKSGQDPELRARRSAAIKERWQDPEYRAKQRATHASLPGRHHKEEALI